MNNIEITWVYDYHRCETCGTSDAEGAIVKLNGEVILDLEPVAHCYDGINYDRSEVYNRILQHLGYNVIVVE